MTRILDLTGGAVLGRLRGINRKHRLRSKHYQEIEDWPETAQIDVLDKAALGSRDHLPCQDAIFVVSDKLKAVLAKVAPDAKFFPADAGGTRVWVVAPLADKDVMYESEGSATYSKSAYQITYAKAVHVTEEPAVAWCQVRNAPLIALGDAVVEAAGKVAWELHDTIAEYRPLREHPYSVVTTRGASAETLELIGAWPAAPEQVPHPLHAYARDEEIDKDRDVDATWTELVHDKDVDDAVLARFCSGLPLPSLRAMLDPDCAKSKLKKRWKDETGATGMRCKGLFVVNAATRELLGSECRYTPIEVKCEKLGQTHAGFFVVEPPAVDWIDWERSDVMFSWNTMYDGYSGLHPTEESYAATRPIVRVAGTNLVLVHRDIKLDSKGFYAKPLHEVGGGLNLDDYVRAT